MGFLRRLFFRYTYLKNPPWDTGISPPELAEYIEHHPPARALDLGCGSGTNAITLAQNGWQVTAVDFIPRAIQIARRKAAAAGVDIQFLVEDVTRLETIATPFELVLDIGCFHNLPVVAKQKYINQLEQLLAPHGDFLLYGFIQPAHPGTGISDADIQQLCERLILKSRQDGVDRRTRASAWFKFSR